jgi:thioester reductase-like protein
MMRRMSEGDMDGYLAALKSGYRQTKCVAELLLRRARKLGLEVNVFRCGMIVGEAQQLQGSSDQPRSGGVANESDWVSRMLCGIAHMRSYPTCKGT